MPMALAMPPHIIKQCPAPASPISKAVTKSALGFIGFIISVIGVIFVVHQNIESLTFNVLKLVGTYRPEKDRNSDNNENYSDGN
jgi:hypothetical protein